MDSWLIAILDCFCDPRRWGRRVHFTSDAIPFATSFLYQLAVKFVNPIELDRNRTENVHVVALRCRLLLRQVLPRQQSQHISRLPVNLVLLRQVMTEFGNLQEAGNLRALEFREGERERWVQSLH